MSRLARPLALTPPTPYPNHAGETTIATPVLAAG